MALPQFANNAACFIDASIGSADTSITLPTGKGALFPALTGSDWFMLTLEDLIAGLREIVQVTARAGDVLTVTRAQEGTTAQAFAVGNAVAAHRLTAGVLAFLATAASASFEGSVTVGVAPTASEVLLRHSFAEPVRIAADLAGWRFTGATNATASTVFTVAKNGVAIGTITIAAGGVVATFVAASDTDFDVGDVLTITAPATPDATLANFGITTYGTRR